MDRSENFWYSEWQYNLKINRSAPVTTLMLIYIELHSVAAQGINHLINVSFKLYYPLLEEHPMWSHLLFSVIHLQDYISVGNISQAISVIITQIRK